MEKKKTHAMFSKQASGKKLKGREAVYYVPTDISYILNKRRARLTI